MKSYSQIYLNVERFNQEVLLQSRTIMFGYFFSGSTLSSFNNGETKLFFARTKTQFLDIEHCEVKVVGNPST